MSRKVVVVAKPNAQQAPVARRRLLIVDDDPLARWSLTSYLQRWYDVAAVASAVEAETLLDGGGMAAMVVSGELPGNHIDQIEAHAQAQNPDIRTVRTVTNVRGPKRPCGSGRQLEKPFKLSDLARLLGVPEGEIPEDE